MAKSTCGRCELAVQPNDGYVLYLEPGGRESKSQKRITVHGECIADEVADGRLLRVSGFAFEVASLGDVTPTVTSGAKRRPLATRQRP